MIEPFVRRRPDGGLVLAPVGPGLLELLREVPQILRGEQPEEVHERLYPVPSEDPDAREEWIRLVHPELFALVAAAREVVGRDLDAAEPAEEGGFAVEIPGPHVHGWISALNAARLAIATLHEVDEGDMEDFFPAGRDGTADEEARERAIAIAKVHLLAMIQGILIDAVNPPPEDLPDQPG